MRTFCEVHISPAATSACWCRISRARSLACARGRAVLKAKPYGGLDGDDEAIVHAQELLSRPAALQLIPGFARGAHEQASAILMQRGTAAPPLAVVGHEYAKEKVWTHLRRYAPATDK